ncbi:MAG: TorF family putative porin, partial [Candidatus Babeliales bacterium]
MKKIYYVLLGIFSLHPLLLEGAWQKRHTTKQFSQRLITEQPKVASQKSTSGIRGKLKEYIKPEGLLAAVTDYRWRGVSQTEREPAVQGQLVLGTKYGFYTNIWGSYVNFFDDIGNRVHAELDFGGGNSRRWGKDKEWNYDVAILYTFYPKAVGNNYEEVIGSIGYRIAKIGFACSSNVLGFGVPGLYLFCDLAHNFPIPLPFGQKGLGLAFHMGTYKFFDTNRVSELNYSDFKEAVV